MPAVRQRQSQIPYRNHEPSTEILYPGLSAKPKMTVLAAICKTEGARGVFRCAWSASPPGCEPISGKLLSPNHKAPARAGCGADRSSRRPVATGRGGRSRLGRVHGRSPRRIGAVASGSATNGVYQGLSTFLCRLFSCENQKSRVVLPGRLTKREGPRGPLRRRKEREKDFFGPGVAITH